MMANDAREQVFVKYIEDIKNAKSEQPKKERFLTLLASGAFFGAWAHDFVDQFAKGSEDGIFNIQRKGKKSGHGFADTQYGSVIIEFEDDLKKTGAHAADQLRDYLSGKWNSGIQARFTLITTDCLVWKIWSPDYDTLIRLEGSLAADEIVFDEPRVFDVREHSADEFYFFINRYMMACDAMPATIDEIKLAFGRGGEIYNAAMRGLYKVYAEIKETPEIRTAFEQWEKLLSIAYGRFQGSDEMFLIHSYLSALAKIMAYVVISGGGFITDGELKSIMTGEAFRAKQVLNFTDEDFFRWMAEHIDDKAMGGALREIANGFDGFNMKSITEDILKGVYQELVDNDMKHSLGEHYTPDWLCAYVVREMKPKRGQKILDPSCGSGSFLKAAANYLIEDHPDITAEELNDSLYGIDVHPLSVQITKATVLIAIGEKMEAAKQPMSLNIFLANTLLLPEKGKNGDLYAGFSHTIRIDDKTLQINRDLFEDRRTYYDVVQMCNAMADKDHKSGTVTDLEDMSAIIKNRFRMSDPMKLNSIYELYSAFVETKHAGRDGIWAFILNNNYSPFFLRGTFDIIVGNPPWLTFNQITTGEYQNEIKNVAHTYNVVPTNVRSFPNLELASIFLGHCVDYFLACSGRLGFVMPRSVFTSDQHGNVRNGEIKRLEVDEVWDLKDVVDLFNVPSCVIFAKRAEEPKKPELIDAKILSGELPRHNASFDEAMPLLSMRDATVHLSRMGNNTAWSVDQIICIDGENFYKPYFKRGATLAPQRMYYVDPAQRYIGGLADRKMIVESSGTIPFKSPWDPKNVSIKCLVDTRFLFETALANNVVPFALNGTNLVILPAVIHDGRLALMYPRELTIQTGEYETAEWFERVSDLWEKYRTDRSAQFTFLDYLDFRGKLTSQPLDRRYIALYIKSAKNSTAVVIDRDTATELPFIAGDNSYAFYTDDIHEAYYLAAFLNSHIVNGKIKPFQALGLMGERDIHKKILDVPLPRYDGSNADHKALAELAEAASIKAAAFVAKQNFDRKGGSLGPAALGKFRNEVREHLKDEMAAMDEMLERIIGSIAG